MKKVLLTGMFYLLKFIVAAQAVEPAGMIAEQQLENKTENSEDNETEDDADLQHLQYLLKHPLELNTAGEQDLALLHLLTPLQIRQLIFYRERLGPLISIYELQAIPFWNTVVIHKIRPFVTVSTHIELVEDLIQRFKHGDNSILVRVSQVPERSKGYLLDKNMATNYYPGSPQKILLRYKYVYKQWLQFGILAEKDAGEQFGKGRQRTGFDFYSFHLFARQIGIVNTLAIGDFYINLGQGLTQWQSLAFKKSADVLNIKRQGPVLQPYNSAGEINFHRGFGITLAKKHWSGTVFFSYKKIDASLNTDTIATGYRWVSSLQTSGYHRTISEITDKGVQRQLVYGASLGYKFKQLDLGLNTISYRFSLPLRKTETPYNNFAPSGKAFSNFSFDYGYTYKNCHFFGEMAWTNKGAKAFVNGLLLAVSGTVDLSLLYRNIAANYQAFNATAFTENSSPGNEKGLYMGVTVRPAGNWEISTYADLYSFPWLKYRIDKPSEGIDFLIQAVFKPNKQLEIYCRYHLDKKPVNVNPDELILSPVISQLRQNLRAQVNFRISKSLVIRNRTEVLWFDKRGSQAEQGFLTYFDLLFKPVLKPISGNIRLQYFETGGYNSRLYAYENDVLYNYSVPVFYDKGYRYYINAQYGINKKITIWARWAQTIFIGKTLIGSGLDEINGSKKTEVRIQLGYKF